MSEEKNGWYFVKGTKESHWLDLYWFECGYPWARASVKWDGCIHFNTVSNEPYDLTTDKVEEHQLENYLHICDIDRFIEQLQQLKKVSLEHFGDWPG